MVNLQVTCKGSGPFNVCINTYNGEYYIFLSTQYIYLYYVCIFLIYKHQFTNISTTHYYIYFLYLVTIFTYLVFLLSAPYNATGNETCDYYMTYDKCDIPYDRYFPDSRTILFFIRNEISETVNQVTINIYEGQQNLQQSQIYIDI